MYLQSGYDGKMDSKEIDVLKPVTAAGNIGGDWLGELEYEMMASMHKLTNFSDGDACLIDEFDREDLHDWH
jgi:hypothetical protein